MQRLQSARKYRAYNKMLGSNDEDEKRNKGGMDKTRKITTIEGSDKINEEMHGVERKGRRLENRRKKERKKELL